MTDDHYLIKQVQNSTLTSPENWYVVFEKEKPFSVTLHYRRSDLSSVLKRGLEVCDKTDLEEAVKEAVSVTEQRPHHVFFLGNYSPEEQACVWSRVWRTVNNLYEL